MNGAFYLIPAGGTIENVVTMLTTFLAYADIDCRQFERCSFHDSAAGIPNHGSDKLHQTQISAMVYVYYEFLIRPCCNEPVNSLKELTAAAVFIMTGK